MNTRQWAEVEMNKVHARIWRLWITELAKSLREVGRLDYLDVRHCKDSCQGKADMYGGARMCECAMLLSVV